MAIFYARYLYANATISVGLRSAKHGFSLRPTSVLHYE